MTPTDSKGTLAVFGDATMMGMGFLRLNKILRKHKWKRSDREEELERFHSREDRLMNGCLIALVVGIVLVIALSYFT